MIQCFLADIKRLLDEVSEETGLTLVHGNFAEIHEKLQEKYKSRTKKRTLPFSDEYLYRKLFARVKDGVEKDATINLNALNLDAIAQALEYRSYSDFIRMEGPEINPVLANCAGTWYSYVRCNSGQPYILRSAVIIYQEKKAMYMKLQGGLRLFQGQLKHDGNCIYCLLESKQEKKLHMVLRTGLSSRPDVLQGVFSGLSSGGDPIAGREVLIRQNEEYGKLSHTRVAISEFLLSEKEEENVIAKYYQYPEKNILKGGLSSTFDLGDLVVV